MERRYGVGRSVYTVSVEPGARDGDGGAIEHRVVVNGVERTVEILGHGPHHLVLRVDGVRVLLHTSPARSAGGAGEGGLWVGVDGWSRLVEPLALERRRSSAAAEAGRTVTPGFPATVVAVLVQVGDLVARGQPLVVVSAMKMEMSLAAPHPGVVRAINTSVGAAVSPGDELVVVEEVEGPSETARLEEER